MKGNVILSAVALIAAACSNGAFASENSMQCDGRQMYNYVDTALMAGSGVVNVANDPAYGGGAVSLALKSKNMHTYNAMIANMREHDLSLARSGCKSLVNGPTKGMMSSLRQVESKIRALVNSQYGSKGILTDGFGDIR